MNLRQITRRNGLIAMLATIIFLMGCGGDEDAPLTAASITAAPDSVVGRRFALLEPGGTSTMNFLQNNRYELTGTGAPELGYFSAARSGDAWNVATTSEDGLLTTQYTFNFATGQATAVVPAEPRRIFPFQDVTNGGATTSGSTTSAGGGATTGAPPAQFAPAKLITMDVQNQASITGPSSYRIHFVGAASGAFSIDLPGYGSGTFEYAPAQNTAQLVLTYSEDLLGDTDVLSLEFKSVSGSTTPSIQGGVQTVAGQAYAVQGTFTYTGVPK